MSISIHRHTLPGLFTLRYPSVGVLWLMVCLLCGLGGGTAQAWDRTGHRLTGEIAYQNLSKCARRQLDHYLSEMQRQYPSVRHPGDMAAFADRLKARGVNTYNHWHYYAQPWFEGVPKQSVCLSSQHALWALTQAHKNVENSKLSLSHRSFYLSFMWHIIGDIHQPLHTINRFSTRTPQGDKGGLKFRIRGQQAKNLHQLWDSGIDHYGAGRHDDPLRWRQLRSYAKKLQKRHPKSAFRSQLQQQDKALWLRESQALAKAIAYDTPYGQKPSPAYLHRASRVAQQQITLSGYRMAQWFEQIAAPGC